VPLAIVEVWKLWGYTFDYISIGLAASSERISCGRGSATTRRGDPFALWRGPIATSNLGKGFFFCLAKIAAKEPVCRQATGPVLLRDDGK